MNKHTEAEKADDWARTREVLMGKRPPVEKGDSVDWLGCQVTDGAHQINLLLLKGARPEKLDEFRGALDQHLLALRRDRGLPIWRDKTGRLRFDHVVLGVEKADLSR